MNFFKGDEQMNYKQLLILSVVIMLFGMTFVSAAESEDSTSIDEVQQATPTTENIPVASTDNNDIKTESSPEIDDSDGIVTSVSTDAVNDYVNSVVQLNATVDRTIPGARLSEGYVVFCREGVNITDLVAVNNGEASEIIMLEDDWIGTSTLTAKYIGTDNIKSSESNAVEFIVLPQIDTILKIDPIVGFVGDSVDVNARVSSVNPGPKINEGFVSFHALYHEFGEASVINGVASTHILLYEDLIGEGLFASYSGERAYNFSRGYVDLTILTKDTPKSSVKIMPNNKVNKRSFNTPIKYVNKVADAHNTYKILVNNNVAYSGNTLTLEALNNIFGSNFANGHLVVYIDGKVVFNATVTDNLSQIIADILDNLVGQHELKIEFTNSEGITNTYKETIVIQ
jgi:hypothetical protein